MAAQPPQRGKLDWVDGFFDGVGCFFAGIFYLLVLGALGLVALAVLKWAWKTVTGG
jgi:hypothetical protein